MSKTIQVKGFGHEDALSSKTHQTWIDEALAGKLRPGSIKRLQRIASRVKVRP